MGFAPYQLACPPMRTISVPLLDERGVIILLMKEFKFPLAQEFLLWKREMYAKNGTCQVLRQSRGVLFAASVTWGPVASIFVVVPKIMLKRRVPCPDHRSRQT